MTCSPVALGQWPNRATMSAPPAWKTGQMRQDLDPAAVLLSCRATVYGLARGISLGIFRSGNPTVTQAIG